ncbi:MAG: ABC transporter ATP-binding protein [Halanaerobiales bacterium]
MKRLEMLDFIKKLDKVLFSGDRFKTFILFVLMLTGNFLDVLSIGALAGFAGLVIKPDSLFNIELLSPIVEFLNISSSKEVLIYGSLFLIFAFIFKNAYTIFYNYVKKRFIVNRQKAISSKLFRIYLNSPFSFHLKRNSSELIRNINGEVKKAVDSLNSILSVLHTIILSFIIIVILLAVEPFMTLISFISLGGLGLLFLRITRNKTMEYGKKALEERKNTLRIVKEGLGSIKETMIMGRNVWFENNFNNSVENLSKIKLFKDMTHSTLKPVIETVSVVGMLIITLFLFGKGYPVSRLVTILSLFALSFRRILPEMNSLFVTLNNIRYQKYSLDPIYEDFTNFEKTGFGGKGKGKLELNDKIEVKDVSYIYPGDGDKVLENVSLEIPKNSAIGLVGATGSGKTTLVDLIVGLLRPTKGEIKVDGNNIKNNIKKWQENIGYIPQSIYLLDDTIKRKIVFGAEEDSEKLWNAIETAQLKDFIESLPEKENTKIGEDGIRLSGGQRQRLGIARAIYENPSILVMDEATSSVDNATEKLIIKEIEKLKEDRTIIVIAHRLNTVKNCDNLFFIKNGKVYDEGSYDDLVEKNSDFKDMVEPGKI